MSISAGDVTFEFLGNTQNLDQAFDKVGPKARAAFVPATAAVDGLTKEMAVGAAGATELGEVMTLSGEKAKMSMYEARGEAGLLGEAFGVHLPRHVRSFVAELPGVGQALSAAFSATAILFVIQAIVELTKKIVEAYTEFAYAKTIWEETTKSVIELNGELVALTKQYEELKKKADDYGKTALQLAAQHKGEVKESVTELTKTLKEEEAEFANLERSMEAHKKNAVSLTGAYGLWKSNTLGVADAFKAYLGVLDPSLMRHKELDEIQNKLLVTNEKLKVKQQELRVSTNDVSTAQDALNKKGAALDEQISKTANEINKLNIQLAHTKVEASDLEIITPINIQNMMKGIAAAHDFGVTLRTDLVQAFNAAKKAEQDFANSGIQDSVARKQLGQEVDRARLALENYGKAEDRFKIRSRGMWKEFRQDAKDGATTMDQVKQLGVTAFDDLSKGMEQAIASALLAQSSFGEALEKATAQALASIASQAIIKALFYTGEGFAALAGFEEQSASEYFSAAGVMAAVGAAAGLAAHAMSGGGGGGSHSTQQGNNSRSNTSNQAGRSGGSTVGVQHFAEGGLVMGPTLAMIGEDRKKEVVLPLEDKRAMGEVGKAIGGHGVNVHVHGHVIGARDVAHLCGQISKRVNRGQAHLQASNSFRNTKRSA